MDKDAEILRLKEENEQLKKGIAKLARYKLDRVLGSMKTRCYKENCEQFENYGGRGIKVCDEWMGKGGVTRFIEWALSNGWTPFLTIDRIDVNGDYCPENCRWVTQKKQCNNMRTNHYIVLNGEKHTVTEWADILGIRADTIFQRIQKLGWSEEKAITEPVKTVKKRKPR